MENNRFFTVLLAITLCMIKLIESLKYTYHFKPFDDFDVTTFMIGSFVQLACLLLLIFIYYYGRKCEHTNLSQSVCFFLFASIVFGLPDFYGAIWDYNEVDETGYPYLKRTIKISYYPIVLALLTLDCLEYIKRKEKFYPPSLSSKLPECPGKRASFLSRITYFWFTPFIVEGYRRPIIVSDLWETQEKHKAKVLAGAFERIWEVKESGKKTFLSSNGTINYHNHVTTVIFKMFRWNIATICVIKILIDALAYARPMILKQLLQYMDNTSDENEWHGLLIAVGFFVIPTTQSFLSGKILKETQSIGLLVRSVIMGAVYRKSMVIGNSCKQETTTGEIVNLMAVDSQRLMDFMTNATQLVTLPLQIVVAIILLYQELGWAVFGGIVCMLLVLPCNIYIGSRMKRTQNSLMKIKDERIKRMNEFLNGIKVLKLYAWEQSIMNTVIGHRLKELKYLRRLLIWEAITNFVWNCSPFLVALGSFAMYVSSDWSGHVLTAEKAFVSISLFNLLRIPITNLPQVISNLIAALVSAGRLDKFLNSSELIHYVDRDEHDQLAISIENASTSWTDWASDKGTDIKAVLKDINLRIAKGSFVAIVGQVASGKSSLLSAILGEMYLIKGKFNVCKFLTLAYVPQQSWIQNMTVRENILFGAKYDETKYQKVMSACCLEEDMTVLPKGDQTEIGEKGVNLSGGQKQRISLARACYSDADIYLLDDPLSAVDPHVASYLYDNVLSSKSGLLRDKTRILTTNNLFLLPYTNQIEVLKDGKIIESGNYWKLLETSGGYFRDLMKQYSDGTTDEDIVATVREKENEDVPKMLQQQSKTNDELKFYAENGGRKSGQLTQSEMSETGRVKSTTYVQYFRAASYSWTTNVIVSFALSSTFNIATNLWLSFWSSDSNEHNGGDDSKLKTTRITVYALLGSVQCFFVLTGSLALALGAIRAATSLHDDLLDRVMHSPMEFFDTTPVGRIVNRFAKDIDVVDLTLPTIFRKSLNFFLQVACMMLIICISFPLFLFLVVPLVVVYCLIQKIFVVTTRQLKRLESISRSPIYSSFSETLTGSSVIRAFNGQNRFIELNNGLVDTNQSCFYPTIIANRWLSIVLEFFGNVITTSIALFSIYHRDTVGAGAAGLAISYAMTTTETLGWFVRQTSDLETSIVSVERIMEYIKNKLEDLWYKNEFKTAIDWPNRGKIEFKHYSTRYRDHTDIVLNDLSFTIRPSEKVAIVGRTGSGKSSLSLALFRILEASPVSSDDCGQILIDDVDIAQLGLHNLRSRLTIIPQDPVLFSGTLRFNLDPLELYTDEEIYRSLELAHLRSHIVKLQDGLDSKVSEYGENFSVGQKQLICLARAILRKSRILVLDEATAAVDIGTDTLIQQTLREQFNDCTVITIAHRLNTILDSDRVMVLNGGRIEEFENPQTLLKNKDSLFHKMAEAANIKME